MPPRETEAGIGLELVKPACEYGQDILFGIRDCRLRQRRINTRSNVASHLNPMSFAGGGGGDLCSYRRCCGIDVHKKSVQVCVCRRKDKRE
jgi:hypothetical protein